MSLKITSFIKNIIILSILSIYPAFSEEKSITFDDGSTYLGSVVGGNMEGKGLFKTINNKSGNQLIYSGEFKEGKFNGLGELDFYNGDSYIGGFLDGYMHGSGLLKYESGSEYEGFFNKGNNILISFSLTFSLIALSPIAITPP